MAVLKLFLVRKFDPERELFGEGWQYGASQVLLTYFRQSLAKTPFSDVDYFWDGTASDVTRFDLVCYLLPTQRQSIILSLDSSRVGQLGGGGTTLLLNNNTVISEIYMVGLRGGDPRGLGDPRRDILLANMVFHEWMHNLLDATLPALQNVHRVPGGAIGVDTAPHGIILAIC